MMTLWYPPKEGDNNVCYFSLTLSTPKNFHTLISCGMVPPFSTLYLLLVNYFIHLLFCPVFKNSNWLIPRQKWLVMTKRFSFFLCFWTKMAMTLDGVLIYYPLYFGEVICFLHFLYILCLGSIYIHTWLWNDNMREDVFILDLRNTLFWLCSTFIQFYIDQSPDYNIENCMGFQCCHAGQAYLGTFICQDTCWWITEVQFSLWALWWKLSQGG